MNTDELCLWRRYSGDYAEHVVALPSQKMKLHLHHNHMDVERDGVWTVRWWTLLCVSKLQCLCLVPLSNSQFF